MVVKKEKGGSAAASALAAAGLSTLAAWAQDRYGSKDGKAAKDVKTVSSRVRSAFSKRSRFGGMDMLEGFAAAANKDAAATTTTAAPAAPATPMPPVAPATPMPPAADSAAPAAGGGRRRSKGKKTGGNDLHELFSSFAGFEEMKGGKPKGAKAPKKAKKGKRGGADTDGAAVAAEVATGEVEPFDAANKLATFGGKPTKGKRGKHSKGGAAVDVAPPGDVAAPGDAAAAGAVQPYDADHTADLALVGGKRGKTTRRRKGGNAEGVKFDSIDVLKEMQMGGKPKHKKRGGKKPCPDGDDVEDWENCPSEIPPAGESPAAAATEEGLFGGAKGQKKTPAKAKSAKKMAHGW